MRLLNIIFFAAFLQACSSDEAEIHRFTGKNGELLGVAYVTYFDKELFRRFRIESDGATIFEIVDERIIGPDGAEGEVSKENLYGYKVELAKPSYIALIMADPTGRGVSDLITIEWVEEKKEFHLQKTP